MIYPEYDPRQFVSRDCRKYAVWKVNAIEKPFESAGTAGGFPADLCITGEFSDLTKKLGGRVLNMDGTDGIINLLEIFQAGDTDHTSYTRHLSKIKTTYQFLKPTAKSEEINTLIEMLEILYEKWGLKPSSKKETRITGLPASRYPILSDLQKVLEEEMQRMIAADYREQEVPLVSRKLMYLDNISSQIRLLVNSYGYLIQWSDFGCQYDGCEDRDIQLIPAKRYGPTDF